jgi:ABC-type uncharacterized transport system auxiliary subunit
MMPRAQAAARLAALSLALATSLAPAACGGKLPDTRYYQLVPPESRPGRGGDELLVLEPLTTDAAYDDERIVYRTTPFRLDYYQYQRWSSAPGLMIGNYLERTLEASGKFRGVVHDLTPDAPVVLAGRVIAIEEVDRSKTEWLGRLVLELMLTDAKTGEALWTQQFDETEPLRVQTPEGLAAALSTAMARVVAQVIPTIADLTQRQAHLRTDRPTSRSASRATP